MKIIAAETKAQDDILIDMSLMAARLHRAALDIQEELTTSNALLDDTISKTDEASSKMESVTHRVRVLTDKVRAGPGAELSNDRERCRCSLCGIGVCVCVRA
jgi:hypothetical protein